MSILTILLVIVLVGVLLWAVDRFIPMSAGMKTLLHVVAAIVVILWLLKVFGLLSTLQAIHV